VRLADPTRAGRAAGALFACLLLAGGSAVAGCGGGDEETTAPSTTPTIEPATPTGPTGAAGEGDQDQQPPSDDTSLDPEDGTVTPPAESEVQTQGGAATEDSAENDIPPKPGSAEEAFEQHCEENPEACG
jgi:hypothetical protein